MSIERMRNVMTGEIRDVETNSDEYAELINEVYDHDGSARPKWELTGQHHARRLDDGDIAEEDHGYQHKPVVSSEVDLSEVGPELHPERAITEAEKEAGIESWEQKQKELNLVQPHENRQTVEPLERTEPEERIEKGREQAGTVGKSRSKRSSRSSGSSGSGGSSGSSGSSSSASGSSGSSSSGGSNS